MHIKCYCIYQVGKLNYYIVFVVVSYRKLLLCHIYVHTLIKYEGIRLVAIIMRIVLLSVSDINLRILLIRLLGQKCPELVNLCC